MEKGGEFKFVPDLSKKELREIVRICSRCGKEMGRITDYFDKNIKPISHGLCENCENKTRKELGLGKKKEKNFSDVSHDKKRF